MKIGDLVKRDYDWASHAKQIGIVVGDHYCEMSKRQSYLVRWAPYVSWRDQGWHQGELLKVVSKGEKKSLDKRREK